MREVCYCGRTAEIEDREPVATEDGGHARSGAPGEACGHLEYLAWLPEEARRVVFEEVGCRQPAAA